MQQLFKGKVVAIDVLVEASDIVGYSIVSKDQAVFFSNNLDINRLLKLSKNVICFNQGYIKRLIPNFNCNHDLMPLYYQLNPDIKFNKDLDTIIKQEYFTSDRDNVIILKNHSKVYESINRAKFILYYYKKNYKKSVKSILKLDQNLIKTFYNYSCLKIDNSLLNTELSVSNKFQWDIERDMWKKVGYPFKQLFQLDDKFQNDEDLLKKFALRNRLRSKYNFLIKYKDVSELEIDLDFCGTSTSRIVCRDKFGLFTPDNDYKHIFTSYKDHTFISCDYSKQEASIIASVSNDIRLQEDLIKPKFYKLLSKKYLNRANKDLGKILFYSLIYGSSVKNISKKLGVDIDQCYDIVGDLTHRYRNMMKWLKKSPQLKYNYYNRPLYTSTANAFIQSTAADLVKFKLLETYKYNPILVFSDNIIYSVPDSLVDEYSIDIKNILESHPEFKLSVKLLISKNLKF